MLKRGFDVTLSIIGIIVALPIFIIMAIIIPLSSPGGVFFRGVRVGKDGKTFRIYKFRSMVKDAEGKGKWNVSNNDSRVTKIGVFLRKTKLDELPQLINVLKGDMSFVGPRPELQYYVDMYTEEEKIILKNRPGITDWASIVHFDQYVEFTNSDDPDKVYLEHIRPLKLTLQKYYANNNSFITDIKIILWTIYKVIFRSQAVPKEINVLMGKTKQSNSVKSSSYSDGINF